jgi:hypothetical protein
MTVANVDDRLNTERGVRANVDIGLGTLSQSVLTRMKRIRLIVDRDDRHIGALSASIRSRETGRRRSS